MRDLFGIIGLIPSLIDCGETGWPKKSLVCRHGRTCAHADTALNTLFKAVKPRKVFRQFDYFRFQFNNGKTVDCEWQESLGIAGHRHF
jgi:hypothetical protein